jgi:signal transduction histidine kinase/CheY-like chemotaxis protein
MNPTHRVLAWLSGATLLIALGVGLSLWIFRQIEEDARERQHTATVIDTAEALLSAVIDAETSQRGYLLTGDENSLALYLAVRNGIRPQLEILRQLTLLDAAKKHLDALVPLVDARLTRLAEVIELRRAHGLTAIQAQIRSGQGQQLMHSIRGEMRGFIQLEQGLLAQREEEFRANMQRLFLFTVIASLLTLILAIAFAYLLLRESRQRFKNLLHVETQRLLTVQEDMNKSLAQANVALTDRDRTLKLVNRDLEIARNAAEKANLAKSEFIASMSHELRTPLNAVIGFAQLMEAAKTKPSSSQQKSIDEILKGGWHLLGLINEILDMAKIESGKTTLSHEPMSLTDVLRDCQAMIDPQAQQRDVRVVFHCLDDRLQVLGDATAVKQVMLNLLSNAVKYNRVGGTVSVKCEMSGERRLRVSVEDTGAGLAAEQLAHLFQPFNRLGKENGAIEGSGIGLVISKKLVELMGGKIGVDSKVGAGSVFWFELASSNVPEQVAASCIVVDDQDVAKEMTFQRTLLYVEDNPASLALVEQLLALRNDLQLLTATDGLVGIKMARESQPDLIVMDINLPGINGFDALKALRADRATAHIPVMALTARATPHDVSIGMEAGFFYYMTKPIKVNEFMDIVSLALDCDRRQRVSTGNKTAESMRRSS